MTAKRLVLAGALLSACAAFGARPLDWRNVDPEHHLAGRMASSGYLRGKVVYLDCRDYGKRSCAEPAQRMEETWRAFKMKQFVMLGSHQGEAGAEKIKRIAEGLGLTYPIYAKAAFGGLGDAGDATLEDGLIYVIESTGKVVYRGRDDRRACGVVASAIMAMRAPQTPKQWRHYLDFDIDVLPGRAFLELEEFGKAFPDEARQYDAVRAKFANDPEIVRLARLERLSQQGKDYDFKDANARRLSATKVRQAIAAFSDLRTSRNPAVAQEAKNCIAELTWTAALLGDAPAK